MFAIGLVLCMVAALIFYCLENSQYECKVDAPYCAADRWAAFAFFLFTAGLLLLLVSTFILIWKVMP